MFIETQQIEQLLHEPAENACKFTQSVATSKFAVVPFIGIHYRSWMTPALAPNAYRIEIRDSGTGIDASVLDSIFEEYTSCSGPNDRSAGLGLAICKMIVNAHGGKIWAASSRKGPNFP